MIFEYSGHTPRIHKTAYVAPNATICGEVTIGANSRILFGAVITAESGTVEIGTHCIIMENTAIRGVARHRVTIGNHVLVGPHAHLTGCTIEDECFIATGASVFNGAVVGKNSVVRINGVVHINTILPAESSIPIGWIAIGNPPEILSPGEHERILHLLGEQNFSKSVFRLQPSAPGRPKMQELTESYAKALGKYREAKKNSMNDR